MKKSIVFVALSVFALTACKFEAKKAESDAGPLSKAILGSWETCENLTTEKGEADGSTLLTMYINKGSDLTLLVEFYDQQNCVGGAGASADGDIIQAKYTVKDQSKKLAVGQLAINWVELGSTQVLDVDIRKGQMSIKEVSNEYFDEKTKEKKVEKSQNAQVVVYKRAKTRVAAAPSEAVKAEGEVETEAGAAESEAAEVDGESAGVEVEMITEEDEALSINMEGKIEAAEMDAKLDSIDGGLTAE